MPMIKKFPTEVFGYPYTNRHSDTLEAINAQYCHYVKGECKKPRKSEPHIKIGICSVGYKGSFQKDYSPVIICPHRLIEPVVFDEIKAYYLAHWNQNPEWVTEVSMGVGGNVDYVATLRDSNGNIKDFLCVEFQAAGTTGSPWLAIEELKKHGKYLSDSYNYGINWANEFMKTMMQQVYKKGTIVSQWNRKIVFVVQDLAIQYLENAVDTSDIRVANEEDEIHFVTFHMVWHKDRWQLTPSKKYSTNLSGINRLLAGANENLFPTESDFKKSIYSKGNRDSVF